MGISTSLVLIAVGAILKWAVTATVSGVNLQTVGVVLMIVGAVGLVLSLIFWSSWGGFRARNTTPRSCATSRYLSLTARRAAASRSGTPKQVGVSSASHSGSGTRSRA